jgi:hypothetical protein
MLVSDYRFFAAVQLAHRFISLCCERPYRFNTVPLQISDGVKKIPTTKACEHPRRLHEQGRRACEVKESFTQE